MINKFIGNGRVTKDIELKQTSNGVPAVNFTLAITRNFKNANGEYEADFIQCTAFRGTAEILSKYVKKGDAIGIEGSIRTWNYKDKDDKTVYVTEIQVENIDFLQQKRKEETTDVPKTEDKQPDDAIIYPDAIEITDDDLPF